jgi:type III pantothenate kinase
MTPKKQQQSKLSKKTSYLLALDLGNTNISISLCPFNTRAKTKANAVRFNLATDVKKTEDDYFLSINNLIAFYGVNVSDIKHVVICSVVPKLDRVFELMFVKYFALKPLFLSADNIGIKINLDNPSEVGTDRLVDALGAFLLAGANKPVLVIDFGTATTFNIVSKDGVYLGGAIFPGVLVSLEALKSSTSKLPQIALEPAKNVIGKSTVKAINSGVFFGYRALIEGMVSKFAKEHKSELFVVATGGLSELICKNLKCINIQEPNLTLNSIITIGLRLIENGY